MKTSLKYILFVSAFLLMVSSFSSCKSRCNCPTFGKASGNQAELVMNK